MSCVWYKISKLPAHNATAKDNRNGIKLYDPVTAIHPAEGAIAKAQPSNRLALQVKRFVYG